jgi:hypothetical protein
MFSAESLKKIKLIKNKRTLVRPFCAGPYLYHIYPVKKVRPFGYTLRILDTHVANYAMVSG